MQELRELDSSYGGSGVLSALTNKVRFRQTNPLQEGQNARRAKSSAKGNHSPRRQKDKTNKLSGYTLNKSIEKKIAKLSQTLKALKKPLYIACSGGLDSRFIAFFAKHIGIKDIKLLHITGVHIDAQESHYLQEWAKIHQFPIQNIEIDILANEEIKNNAELRCYHCKHIVFSTMLSSCCHGTLCDGTHFDDTKSHRPGLKALQELSICSPLAQSGFTKADIKNIAKQIGLDNPNQKAKPCLLTRFDYDSLITKEKLEKIALAENIVFRLLKEEAKKDTKKEFDENTLPDFRIREITKDNYELHSVQIIPLPIIQALQEALKQANILSIQYKQLEVLSSYFDRNR